MVMMLALGASEESSILSFPTKYWVVAWLVYALDC